MTTSEPVLLPCPFCEERLERSEQFSNRSADTYMHPDNGCILALAIRVIVPLQGYRTDREGEMERIAAWNRRPSRLREEGRDGWVPNTDYQNENTWPPNSHPLANLFHKARLEWPANPDSRADYEGIAAWLSPTPQDNPEGENEQPSAVHAALRAFAAASKTERCLICNSIEGCDHTVRERLRANLGLRPAPDTQAGGVDMPDDLRSEFGTSVPSNWAEVLESRARASYLDDTAIPALRAIEKGSVRDNLYLAHPVAVTEDTK